MKTHMNKKMFKVGLVVLSVIFASVFVVGAEPLSGNGTAKIADTSAWPGTVNHLIPITATWDTTISALSYSVSVSYDPERIDVVGVDVVGCIDPTAAVSFNDDNVNGVFSANTLGSGTFSPGSGKLLNIKVNIFLDALPGNTILSLESVSLYDIYMSPLNVQCEDGILLILSHPPAVPSTPEGPSKGTILSEYKFFTKTTDPDGNKLFYKFDWGNGLDSVWFGPYESGEEINATYIWEEPGTYQVKVRAKDKIDISDWSAPITVFIGAPELSISIVTTNGVGIHIVNNGTGNATNVAWNLKLRSNVSGRTRNMLIFFGKETNGIITDFGAPANITVGPRFLFGFGAVEITSTVESSNYVSADLTKTITGFLLGRRVIMVQEA